MVIYWLMFLAPACAAVTTVAQIRFLSQLRTKMGWGRRLALTTVKRRFSTTRRQAPIWIVAGTVLALLIGLRYQVGGDWGSYLGHYYSMMGADLVDAVLMPDPGYYLLNWLSVQVNGDVVLVNLVSGALFSIGLIAFCYRQPHPWLALTVAIPYMVIVVAMGYSRQGIALGLAMLGLVGLERGNNIQFVVCVALAATFHKSAVLLVPFAMLASPRGRWWTALWVGAVAVGLYWVLLADSVDSLVTNYIDAEYQSQGAFIRIAMSALSAALLLVFWKRFSWKPAERNLWTMMALGALALMVVLLVTPASTAVDRVGLYLLPLQLYVLTRLPDILGHVRQRVFWVAAVVAVYGAVLFVWLNFATHARYWVPYSFYPIDLL